MNKTIRKPNAWVPIFLMVVLLALGWWSQDLFTRGVLQGSYGRPMDKSAYNFRLYDAVRERPVQLSDFAGKSVFLFFGFTRCTTVCPTDLMVMKELADQLGTETCAYVFISIDPVRDSAAAVARYVSHFSDDFYGLVSGGDDTGEVASHYQSRFTFNEKLANEDPGYQVSHSGAIYLVDGRGQLRFVYPEQNPSAELIIKDYEELVEE